MTRVQRLVFGEVAELYDRARPSYPQPMVDEVIALIPPSPERALEVGAGTGKATALFAGGGLEVLALEPSAEMAEVAVRRLAGLPVEVARSDLESFDGGQERFRLVFSGQAWHWIDAQVRAQRVAALLSPGGVLAAFWNRPRWEPGPLRDALRDQYARLAPDLVSTAVGPGAVGDEAQLWEAWEREAAAAGLCEPEFRAYSWSIDYDRDAYLALLSTQSPHRLLAEEQRGRLLEAIGEVLDAHGGGFTQRYETWLCLARQRPNVRSSSRTR